MQLSLIESQLKEFVRLHHLDLTRKINFQINKFKDHIREKELFQQLSSYPLTNEQVKKMFLRYVLYILNFLVSNKLFNVYVIFVNNNWKDLKK